ARVRPTATRSRPGSVRWARWRRARTSAWRASRSGPSPASIWTPRPTWPSCGWTSIPRSRCRRIPPPRSPATGCWAGCILSSSRAASPRISRPAARSRTPRARSISSGWSDRCCGRNNPRRRKRPRPHPLRRRQVQPPEPDRLSSIPAPLQPLQAIGRSFLNIVWTTGAVAVFAGRAVLAVALPPWFPGQFARQLIGVGYLSLPVVGLTAAFTGAALALNIYTGGGRFNAEQIMPQIVALGITRELGPVLAALMLAGRVSAAFAAEIGAMRATEQIDALHTLSTDPFRYLIAPR